MTKKIYTIRDNDVICAASTYDDAIMYAMRYLFSRELQVDKFTSLPDAALINYTDSYRLGAEIIHNKGIIEIDSTVLYVEEPE